MAIRAQIQHGFTLLEVLIAVVILAFGLLGIAALQLTSLQNNGTAYERSQATILAYDIIDRMRANRTAATAGQYNISIGTAPSSAICTGSSANCSTSQMATYDVAQWKCSLGTATWTSNAACTSLGISQGVLPLGDGAINIAGNLITVTVRWNENLNQTTTAAQLTSLSINTVL